MIKLLLVDDEDFTREGILENIDFESLSILKIKDCDNGEEALEIAAGLKPDILLTDVRMPVVDGIELAFGVRRMFPECEIIFMSGFADKEYLKSAISLGAVAYIEKPISLIELTAALSKAVFNIEGKKEASFKAQKIARENLAYDFTRKMTEKEIISGVKKAGLPEILDSYITSAVLQAPPEDIEDIYGKIEDNLSAAAFNGIFTLKNERYIIIHFFYNKEKAYYLLTEDVIERFFRSLFPDNMDGIIISIGERAIYNSVYTSYQSAIIGLEKYFYYGYGIVKVGMLSNAVSASFNDQKINMFYESLKLKDKKTALSLIFEIEDYFKQHCATLVKLVKNYYYKLSLSLYKIGEEHDIPIFDRTNDAEYLWEAIYKIETLKEMTEFLSKKLDIYFENINIDSNNNAVFNIKKYIERHYTDCNLSIDRISEHIFLNPSYMCVLFKTETGLTINSYITELRLEKARELLVSRSHSITDVAEQSGYSNANYFAKVFKKYTGMQPKEYKEKYEL